MKNVSAKVAIFYDWLNQWGGAEKVLLDLLKIFPHAPVYTLVHDPQKTAWLPPNTKVICSFINHLPLSKINSIIYTPIYPLAIEQFDFSEFDLLISTTSTIGHCLLTPPKTKYICYFHNVNRHIYQKKYIFPVNKIISAYQKIDKIYSFRPDYLFCNSKTVQNRILKTYHRSAKVINPGIDTDFFTPSKNSQNDYFLTVSRLVSHKKVELAILACHQLKQKLYIVGSGRDQVKLNNLVTSLNDPHIQLLGQVSDQKLLYLYQNCQALICPQLEDFGLSPIEAQACGKPVIAFKKGGLTETVVNHKTGIFFKYQTIKSLSYAIQKFKSHKFSSKFCRQNALRFSSHNFMLNFKKEIETVCQEHP